MTETRSLGPCAIQTASILAVLAAITILGCLDPQSGPKRAAADGADHDAGDPVDSEQGPWTDDEGTSRIGGADGDDGSPDSMIGPSAADVGLEPTDSGTGQPDATSPDLGVRDGGTDPAPAIVSMEPGTVVLQNAPRFRWILFWVARPDQPPYHTVRCVAGESRAAGMISFALPDPPLARRCFLPSTNSCREGTYADASDPAMFRLGDGVYRATSAECGDGSGESYAAFAWRP